MIDASPPGSWRNALSPAAPACRACGQNECGHSDLEYQGVMPAIAPVSPSFHDVGDTDARR